MDAQDNYTPNKDTDLGKRGQESGGGAILFGL